MSNRRKFAPLLAMIPFTAMMGLISFNGVASNPRFETIHTLDVIRLMTAGAFLALTIAGIAVCLAMYFRGSPSEDKIAEEQRARESN